MSSPPGNQLGSRNPFLGLLTPQSTGATPNGPNTSGPAASSTSATYDAPPALPPKDKPTPRLERQNTGALNSTSITPSYDAPSYDAPRADATRTPYQAPGGPPPPLPPRAPDTMVTSPDNQTGPARSATLDFLQEDLPPAYTPGPNAVEGERSVDFGPIRPFQPPVRPPPQAVPVSAPATSSYFSPPQHNRSNSSGRNPGSLSQALGSLLLAALTPPPGEQSRRSGLGSPPGSYPRSTPSAPSEPIRPPQPSQNSRAWSQYPGQSNRSRTPEPQPLAANDGKPTVRPIAGHPLLKDNRVLVYPLGFECRKCFNKGFRPLHASTFDDTPRALAPGDPSHPCKKCWHRYARPYTQALSILDWTDLASETNFQRPISDSISPPTARGSSSAGMQRAATTAGFRETLMDGLRESMRDGGGRRGSSRYTGAPGVRWTQTGPQGGAVYEPGDPRIGGRLCVRCLGAGRVRVFILESETCQQCGGIGRVF